MSIRNKQMILVLLAVLLPMLISLSVSKYFSGQTRDLAAKETMALAQADIRNILEGSRNLLATNKTAMDQGRINTIKTFLRSAADLLYDQVSKIFYTLPKEQQLAAARTLILAGKCGTSGYAFAMNSNRPPDARSLKPVPAGRRLKLNPSLQQKASRQSRHQKLGSPWMTMSSESSSESARVRVAETVPGNDTVWVKRAAVWIFNKYSVDPVNDLQS